MTNAKENLDSPEAADACLCLGCGGPEVGGGLNYEGKYYCSSCWKRPKAAPVHANRKRRRRCSGRGFGLDRFCSCGIRPDAPGSVDPDYFGKYAYFSAWNYDQNLPKDLTGQSYIDTHCHLDFLLQNIRSGGVSWTWKTEICTFWLEGECTFEECGFAHGEDELRPRYPLTAEDLRSFAERHPVEALSNDAKGDFEIDDEVCGIISPPTLRYLITSACDLSSIEDCLFLSKVTTPYLGGSVYVTFGCHPHTYREYSTDYERQMLEAMETCGSRVVGIGECGLDYFKNYYDARDPIARARMVEVFVQQTKLAIDHKLPLVVHARDAEEDTLRVLQQLPRDHKVHIHAFQGSLESMKDILDLLPNAVIGVSGIVTKPNAFPECLDIARECPLDRMVLESDAPFLSGEPREIPRLAVKVAELKGVSAIEVLAVTNKTSENFYNFSRSFGGAAGADLVEPLDGLTTHLK